MNILRLTMLVFGALLVSLMLTGEASGNPLVHGVSAADGVPVQSNEEPALSFQSRVGMVQTLTCTNPNCLAQCRGRGYRRGSCQIGRCFCSYL